MLFLSSASLMTTAFRMIDHPLLPPSADACSAARNSRAQPLPQLVRQSALLGHLRGPADALEGPLRLRHPGWRRERAPSAGSRTSILPARPRGVAGCGGLPPAAHPPVAYSVAPAKVRLRLTVHQRSEHAARPASTSGARARAPLPPPMAWPGASAVAAMSSFRPDLARAAQHMRALRFRPCVRVRDSPADPDAQPVGAVRGKIADSRGRERVASAAIGVRAPTRGVRQLANRPSRRRANVRIGLLRSARLGPDCAPAAWCRSMREATEPPLRELALPRVGGARAQSD